MWVVMVRVKEQSKWCAHGPFANWSAARAYDHGLVGLFWARQIVRLIEPWKAKKPHQEQQG